MKAFILIILILLVGGIFLLNKSEDADKAQPQTANVQDAVSKTTEKVVIKPTSQPVIPEKNDTTPKITPSKLNIVDRLLPLKNSEPRTTPITHVLIHFISNVSANQTNPHNVRDIINIFLNTGLSSHYLIGRDGTVYRLTPENRVAYHGGKGALPKFPTYTNKINNYSIGIEIAAIGTKEEMTEFVSSEKYDAIAKENIGYTEAQYASLKKLLEEIYERYPAVTRDRDHVIGHDEYAPGRKHDPGSLFDWSKIGF